MDDKKAEIVLGAIGAFIAIVLGVGQLLIGHRQNQIMKIQTEFQQTQAKNQAEFQQKNAQNTVDIQVIEIASQYFDDLGKSGEKGEQAEKIVTSLTPLSQSLAIIAESIIARNPNISQDSTLVIRESTNPAKEDADWFAVLGSYSIEKFNVAQIALLEKERVIQQTDPHLKLDIFKTKISNNFALTVGGRLKKGDALKLVARARKLDWANDAFAQIDRSWTSGNKFDLEVGENWKEICCGEKDPKDGSFIKTKFICIYNQGPGTITVKQGHYPQKILGAISPEDVFNFQATAIDIKANIPSKVFIRVFDE